MHTHSVLSLISVPADKNNSLGLLRTVSWRVLLVLLMSGAITISVRAQNDVTFQVNMKVRMLEGTFLPQDGDFVTVRAGFNNWGFNPPGNLDTLKDENGDSIYTKTLSLGAGYVEYKFWKSMRGGQDWEGDPNREYTVLTGSQTLPVVYFDGDSVYESFPLPAISSISPQSGDTGISVTVNGTNFSSTPSENVVYFGTVRAAVTAATSTELNVTVPLGASYAPVTVTTHGLTAYSADPFVLTFASSRSIDSRAFASGPDITTTGAPFILAVADFDGDGKNDVVSASSDSSILEVFRNTSTAGAIAFATGPLLRTASAPYDVYVGDIDGDGNLDLVSALYSAGVSVFRNTSTPGSLSFAARVDSPVEGNLRRVALNDFDGDGKMDIAVTCFGSAQVKVLRNTGSVGLIQFESPITVSTETSPHFILSGDVDGDGKPDLVVGNYNDGTISVLRNTSTPGAVSFAPKVILSSFGNPYMFALGDLDGDGKLDLAVPNFARSSVALLRNTSAPGAVSFEHAGDLNVGDQPRRVALGDIDGDGKVDLVANSSTTGSLSVYQNVSTSGNISFVERPGLSIGSGSRDIALADFDGNGQPDILTTDQSQRALCFVRNGMNTQIVTFQVNMKVQFLEGTFGSYYGDVVIVAGSFNGWSTEADTLSDADGDSIFTKSVGNLAAEPIEYKFCRTFLGGISWESDPNRNYTVTTGTQSIPVVYYDRDSSFATLSDRGSAYFKDRSTIRVVDGSPIIPAANQSAYMITGTTMTVEAWIFSFTLPPCNNADGIVVRPFLNASPFQGYDLSIGNPGPSDDPRIRFKVSNGSESAVVRDTSTAATGVWKHVAATCDGSFARLYVDGVLVSSVGYSGTIGAGNTGFFIGGLSGSYFHGLIDEVRLWNVVRSQTEIQTYMDSTLMGNEPGLVGYWPLDQQTTVNGQSGVTLDKTANHNDLWVMNGAEFIPIVPRQPVALAPQFQPVGPPATYVGALCSFRPLVSGWPVPTLSFLSGPAGTTFEPITDSVKWTPSSTQMGLKTFSFRAVNAVATKESTYSVWVDAYATMFEHHSNNNTQFYIGNNGMLGHDSSSTGFQFNGLNGLYEGTLVIGRSASQVSGTLYFREFGTRSTVEPITSYLAGFDQAYESRYDDSRSVNPIGVSVVQRSHSKSTDPDRNFVILDYEIRNTGEAGLDNIYVGIAADLDVGVYSSDLGGCDTGRGLSYIYEKNGATNPNYYGIVAVSSHMSGYGFWSVGVPEAESVYYRGLTTPGVFPSYTSDYRSILGTGPYGIPAGRSVRVMFALVAGTSLSDLQANADEARGIRIQPNPSILSVRDVPGDQGGKVFVNWTASSLDNLQYNLPFYSIWRSVPQGKAVNGPLVALRDVTVNFKGPAYRSVTVGNKSYFWEWIANQPAHRFVTYSYAAQTLFDSTAETNKPHYFLVSAQTSDQFVYYDSNIDSGYSVDNLAPIAPRNARLIPLLNGPIQVQWDYDRIDPDVGAYEVYRSTVKGFQCSESTLVLKSRDTVVTDTTTSIGTRYYYRVRAVDIHDNRSEPTGEMTESAAPIQLVSFTGRFAGPHYVVLEWVTISEVNNYGFEVQRRASNQHVFAALPNAFVPGYGTSLEQHRYSWTDSTAVDGSYVYRLRQIDLNGDRAYSQEIVISGVSWVDDETAPIVFQLLQNYPNPFNPVTIIKFSVDHRQQVTVRIFNMLGQEVAQLYDGVADPGHYYKLRFDASSASGGLGSGVYIYRIVTDDHVAVKKLLFLK